MNETFELKGIRQVELADLDLLVERLRAVIRETGGLPPERTLSDLLHVKRHQIRRALEVLRLNGEIVPPKPRKRPASKQTGLTDMASNTSPIEVVELRLMIEPALAKLAARRATPNQIASMQKAILTQERGEKLTGDDLHRIIALASGNSLADEFHRLLRGIEMDARLRANYTARPDYQDLAQHKAIVDAIAAREPDEAELAMRIHLETLRSVLMVGHD